MARWSLPLSGASWLIVRREPHDPEPDTRVEDHRDNRNELELSTASYGRSAAEWYVYARRS